MNLGDVLYYYDHQFPDGGHADKLFIVISDPSQANVVLVMVTSHGKDANNKGCQPNPKKFLFKKGEDGFPKDTWVDLARNIDTRATDRVQSAIDSGKVVVKSTLSTQRVNEIRNCLTRHAIENLTRGACETLGVTPKW